MHSNQIVPPDFTDDKSSEFYFESMTRFNNDLINKKRELLRANHELNEKNAVLSAVASELEETLRAICHDLKSPLCVVKGFSGILDENLAKKTSVKEKQFLQSIVGSADKMERIIGALSRLAKLGDRQLILEPVNLSEIAEKAASDERLFRKGTNTEIAITQNMITTCDRELIKLVYNNLIGNAFKYCAQATRPYIDIGSECEKGETWYYVRDNGVGFDMKNAPRLFKAFQRLHSEKEFEGTGIGLVTVWRIIKRHGGKIEASGKVNEGAKFKFTLPTNTKYARKTL